MSALKLLVLTIASSILVSGVMNQAPTPTPSVAMDTALDAIVTGKCWRSSDLTSLTFSATSTTRRAQAPTPTPTSTCPADWTTVGTKWTANNVLVGTFTTEFNTAMTAMTTCLSRRRLQAPTPTPPNCTDANTSLATALDTLGQTLMGVTKAQSLVTAANAVTLASGHTAVTASEQDGGAMAAAAWAAYNTLRNDCADSKLMTLPTRRAQAPTPAAPVADATCTTNLATVLAFRATRIAQVTALITEASAAACLTPTRRLRRIMRLKYEERSLQAPTPHYCDTAEKAIRLALACLTINGEAFTASTSSSSSTSSPSSSTTAANSTSLNGDASASTNGTSGGASASVNVDGSAIAGAATDIANGLNNLVTGGDTGKSNGKCASYVMKIAAVGVMSLAAMFL